MNYGRIFDFLFMKFTLAYTFLFLYVIAAIVFWGYSLNKQSNLIYTLEKEKIELLSHKGKHELTGDELAYLKEKKIRRTRQYLGEGSTFILIILLTAGIVYYAYYRQRSLAKLQQNFMLSVTHELKTPIAGIKLNLQTLAKHQLDEATQKKIVNSSVQETNRLNDLCNNILAATQLESTKKALYTEMVNINEMILDTVNQLKSRFVNVSVLLDLTQEPVTVHADKALWQLVLSNLIENARKYSPNDKPIRIELRKSNHIATFRVADEGPGIPDDEKEKVFTKFYRIGNENTRSTKGTGLGLFIVKKIVSLYKYDISVKNNQPNGTIFELQFS